MTAKEVMQSIMEYKGINVPALAILLGVTPQTIYDMFSGKTTNLSPRIKALIVKNLPEINQEWLLKGEGAMINESYVRNVNGDNIINGDKVNVANSDTAKFLELLAKKEDSLAKAQEHISQLIKLLATK